MLPHMRAARLCLALLLGACGSRSGLSSPPAETTDADAGGSGGGAGAGGSAGSGGGAGAGGTPSCAFGAEPVTLAAGISRAYAIAVDEAFVFVTSAVDGGELLRIPKAGGPALALLTGLGRPRHLALDAERVWVTSPMDGRVLAATKDGAAVQQIVAASPGHPAGIARAGTTTVWVRQGPGVKGGALFAWEPESVAPTLLASGLDSPGALVVSEGHAFWIDNTTGNTPGIWHFAPATTAVPQLLAPLPAANGNDLALDDSHVYYAMNAEVGRVHRDGGARQVLSSGAFAHGVALGGPHLYWVEGGATSSGRLARVPRAGGSVETLATGLVVPRDVALDEACVYWTNQGVGDASGSVMARAR